MDNLYNKIFKRVFDIIISSLALLVLFPIFLLILIILFIVNRGNPFFSQRRPGRYKKEIFVLKFKTMSDQKDTTGNLLPDKERVTKVGKMLRNTSLDELPQLINVIRGDMSLIGPRPLLFEYIPLHSGDQELRYEVRPGITGWAQVNGRNTIPWTKKFEFDAWYVKNVTLSLDFQIIYLTLKKVLYKEGIESNKPQEIRRFDGTN